MSTALKIIVGFVAIIVVAVLFVLFILGAPLTGVGVKTEKLERVSAFSFEVDLNKLNKAELTLSNYAHEHGLKISRFDIPLEGRKVFHLNISLSPSEASLTADNIRSPNRLDVRVSSIPPVKKWESVAQDIEARLQRSIGPKLPIEDQKKGEANTVTENRDTTGNFPMR